MSTPTERPFGDIAPFACRPENSRGRQFAEPDSAMRSGFQRDRDRILHSAAFRRLKHKTQVFVYHEGDYYRTRLTHSLEVAQIARSLCRYLGLNEDLGEALALAHDLGHPPFGHAGEDALQACMAPFGGFDHNAQSLRLLTTLERRYGAFDGLNLTWETLEGVAKHNGPLMPASKDHPLDETLAAFNAGFDLELDSFASAEAQIAAISDDIAYNNHDIDDGVRAGILALEDLRQVPLVAEVMDAVLTEFPGLSGSRLKHETVRRLIDRMVRDLVSETVKQVAAHKPASASDVRQLGQPLVRFSAGMAAAEGGLKAFLFKHMYRHYKVRAMADAARSVVRDLFDSYMADPAALPPEWQDLVVRADKSMAARHICDFIAGMTDRFALREHVRLIGPSAPSALTDEHF